LQLYRLTDVAALCRVSLATVQRAVRNGELAHIRLSGGYNGARVRPAALLEWQNRGMPSGFAAERRPRSRCFPITAGDDSTAAA
jgi:excisionase family DNA binding protein